MLLSPVGQKSSKVLSEFLQRLIADVRGSRVAVSGYYSRWGRSEDFLFETFLAKVGDIEVHVCASLKDGSYEDPHNWNDYGLTILRRDALVLDVPYMQTPINWPETLRGIPDHTESLVGSLFWECRKWCGDHVKQWSRDFQETLRGAQEKKDAEQAESLRELLAPSSAREKA